jgi:putative addiction module killer protein
VGNGVSEMRIDYSPGYRMYFVQRRKTVVIPLCGSDKRSQARDIVRAIEMAQKV